MAHETSRSDRCEGIAAEGCLLRSDRVPCTRLFLALGIVLVLSRPALAQQQVRSWPDPGYRQLGVYASGPESHFDYRLVKMKLADTFPNKKPFWTGVKTRGEERDNSRRHDIYFIYCGERTDSLETVKARVDAWLKPEPDIPTYPKLIPAICIGEENVTRRNVVLDNLARHIRETYGIPVFQF